MMRRRLVYIGLFTVLTLVSMVSLYEYMKGRNVFRRESKYYVRFGQVDGLYRSNRVVVNGLRVGQVSSIGFADDLSGDLLVELTLPSHRRICRAARAEIVSTGLIGGRVVRLHDAIGAGPYLRDGDTLLGVSGGGYGGVMESGMGPLVSNADTLLESLKVLLRSIPAESLVAGIRDAQASVSYLRASFAELPGLVSRARGVVDRADRSLSSLEGVLESARRAGDTLSRLPLGHLVSELTRATSDLSLFLREAREGRGTLGRLVSSDSLHESLVRTTRQLDSLARDIQAHPGRYVRFSLF